ncbi:hypothetical protein ADUPG1_014012, partial [Aduncisulcus paluster]
MNVVLGIPDHRPPLLSFLPWLSFEPSRLLSPTIPFA